MKERPILFSGQMVRAILAGEKTQTRRVIAGCHDWPSVTMCKLGACWATPDHRPYPEHGLIKCPYGSPGDRLWVRETFCCKCDDQGYQVYNTEGNLDSTCCHYAADGYDVLKVDGDGFHEQRSDGSAASPWRPSIHMPRWASRLTLEVTVVRVERLQDISEQDAKAEGVDCIPEAPAALLHRTSFARLWDNLNEKRGYSWDSNPWVWVIGFRRDNRQATVVTHHQVLRQGDTA